MTRLPLGLERFLKSILPRDQHDPIVGDLLEEYALRGWFATWWSAVQVAASFTWERVRRDRTLPPIADESPTRTAFWSGLAHDVAFGVRVLRRQQAFAILAIGVLALGIGATTAMFSLVDAVLWRPLPFPHADRVVSLAEQRPQENIRFGQIAPADFFDWRRDSRSFAAMAAYKDPPSGAYTFTGVGEPERVRALQVSPAFLAALGIAPALGRDFRRDEEIVGQHRVALVSDGLWRRRFGADRAVVGRIVAFESHSFEIVGVLPPTFWWPTRPDVLVPLALDDHDRALRHAHFLSGVARLAEGVSLDRARNELLAISTRLSQQFPTENAGHAAAMQTLRDTLVGDVRPALLVLLGAVGFVLLIAGSNVATLLLARAAGRHKEMAIRLAIGASRARLVQQLVLESLVIALVAGAAGLGMASWALALVRDVLPAGFTHLPGIAGADLDPRVLAAALAVSIATGLVFGIVPAFASSDSRCTAGLSEEARGSSGGVRTHRWRATLAIVELALSLVLLAGAALLLVSFNRLMNVSPGFRPEQLAVSTIALPSARYGEHAEVVAFFDAVFERLRSAPGVQRVAATTSLPLDSPDSSLDLAFENRAPHAGEGPLRADPRIVSADYFATLGIPLVRGRLFTAHDSESAAKAAIINASVARRYWPNDDPIGRRISLGSPNDWRTIVGVVGDVHHEGLDADAGPAVYLPQHQLFEDLGSGFERTMTLVIRSSNVTSANASIIRSAVSSVDPQLAIGDVRTMEDVIDDSIAPRRLNFLLVSVFAVIALVLAGVGLYGVMSYVVVQRAREIGVRMALGASRRQVLGMIVGQAGRMTAVGIATGVAGALALTRTMSSLLFGVSAVDPLIYVGVSALLAVVALVAAIVPASRATRIDPLAALRDY